MIMSSEDFPKRNHGIYHSLPNFDPNLKNLTVIVTGANGISGFYTMRALLLAPERWTKIYAISRKPPPPEMMDLLTPDERSRVKHVAVDFLKSADVISAAMRAGGIKNVDYVFFYSYLQPKQPPGTVAWSNDEELVKVNSALLKNFLDALKQTRLVPKRVLLQTGAKNYGVHIGRVRMPALESDPQPKHLAPNFYYAQEDLLFDFCKSTGAKWNVVMPAWIIGAVTNAQINALAPLAYYAAVQAHKGEALHFPGDWTAWQHDCFHSTAFLTGFLSEWAILEDKCANERFNAQDTSPLSWDRLYEELVRWYGAKGVNGPEEDKSKYSEFAGKGGKDVPMGYGPPMNACVAFSFVQWAQEPANRRAWEEIMTASNGKVKGNPFAPDEVLENFQMGDFAVATSLGCLSMNKARKLGWTGFVDTRESIFQMYDEMAKLGLLPEMKVKEARPMK